MNFDMDFYYVIHAIAADVMATQAALVWPTPHADMSWWRHNLEMLSALLPLCEGNPPVWGTSQSAANSGLDVFFDVSLNKPLNKPLSCG